MCFPEAIIVWGWGEIGFWGKEDRVTYLGSYLVHLPFSLSWYAGLVWILTALVGHTAELGLLSLKKRWLGQDLINVHKYLKAGCKEDGARLISVVPNTRTRSNGHKLEHRTLPVNIRKHFSAVQVMECWHRLPRSC